MRMILNPAFWALEQSKNTQITILIITFSFSFLSLIWLGFSTFMLKNKYGGKIHDTKVKIRFLTLKFISFYFFSIYFVTFVTGYFACKWNTVSLKGEKMNYYGNGQCNKIEIWMYFGFFFSLLMLIRVYFGISVDYDRRILKTNFCCKRNNKTGSRSFLLHLGMIICFHLFNPGLIPVDSSMIFLFGFFGIFLIKANSENYICQRLRNIEVVAVIFSAWICVTLTTLIVNFNFF